MCPIIARIMFLHVLRACMQHGSRWQWRVSGFSGVSGAGFQGFTQIKVIEMCPTPKPVLARHGLVLARTPNF